MTINIIQTITNILDESRKLVSKTEFEGYMITPGEGKALKNRLTGELHRHKIYVYGSNRLKDYVEVDLPDEQPSED